MIIKNIKGELSTISSFNQKLEEEVDDKNINKDLLLKHLAKEFEVELAVIYKFWTIK